MNGGFAATGGCGGVALLADAVLTGGSGAWVRVSRSLDL